MTTAIGTCLPTDEAVDACPAGTVIRWPGHNPDGNPVIFRVKRDDGLWCLRDDRSDPLAPQHLTKNQWEVISYPSLVVGYGITERWELEALPVGSVLDANGQYQITKSDTGRWVGGPRRAYANDHLSLFGHNTIVQIGAGEAVSLPNQTSQEQPMSITTMEQLEAAPAGTVFRMGTGDVRWVRQGIGLRESDRDQEVPLRFFAGALNEGLINRVSAVSLDHVYWDDGGWYLVPVEIEDTTVHAVRLFSNGNWESMVTETSTDNWQQVEGDRLPPSLRDSLNIRRTAEMGHAIRQAREQQAAAEVRSVQVLAERHERVRVAEQGQAQRLAEISQSLRTYLDENDYASDSTLDRLMEEMGLECRTRPSEDIEVEVEISGTTEIELDCSDVEYQIHSARLIDAEPISTVVEWTHTATITVTVEEGDCGCDEVDRSMVEDWLRNNDVNYSRFEYTAEDCPNC